MEANETLTHKKQDDANLLVDVQRYLTFSLMAEEYGVPLLKVKEVIAMTEVTPVPFTPPYFRGIMNLRGQVISVADLRLKFKMAKADFTPETAIIILDLGQYRVGVIVDSINSVLAVRPDQIEPPPEIEGNARAAAVMGVAHKDQHLVMLLDIDKIMSADELRAMSKQGAK